MAFKINFVTLFIIQLLCLNLWKFHCTLAFNKTVTFTIHSSFEEEGSASGIELNDQPFSIRDTTATKKDYKKLCTEIAKFTPFMCEDPIAKKKCDMYCNESCAEVLPGIFLVFVIICHQNQSLHLKEIPSKAVGQMFFYVFVD